MEDLARDTACRAAGQIGESDPPRSMDVRKGSPMEGREEQLGAQDPPVIVRLAGCALAAFSSRERRHLPVRTSCQRQLKTDTAVTRAAGRRAAIFKAGSDSKPVRTISVRLHIDMHC